MKPKTRKPDGYEVHQMYIKLGGGGIVIGNRYTFQIEKEKNVMKKLHEYMETDIIDYD